MRQHCLVFAALLLCLIAFSTENKYFNPVLNPVTFEQPGNNNELELVKDGKLNFAIVCDLSAETGQTAKARHVYSVRKSVSLALEGLQHAFFSTTGQKATVLTPNAKELENFKYWIVLGDNPLTRKYGVEPDKMALDEFKVLTFDRGVIIAGKDGSAMPSFYNSMDISRIRVNGTAYGAFDFCERFLGMRYYYPNIGIYAPKFSELTISPVAYHDKPVIQYHYSYSLSDKKVPGKKQLSDFSPAWRNGVNTRYYSSHTPEPRALAKAYPDKINMFFFRNRAGHLYYNSKAHMGNYFDVTNPEFINFYVDELVTKYYAGDSEVRKAWGQHQPNSEYVPFGQADTYVADMLNERSKPFLLDETKHLRTGCLSDVYANFYIQLAKKLKEKFPDKKLAVSAYSSRTLPPVRKYEWPDNLRMKICMGCPVMTPSKPYRDAWKSVYDRWYKTTGRPAANYCYGVGTYAITKAIQGRYMGDFIKLLGDALWKEYIFFDAGHDNHFYYSYYPAYRAMWNPDFNAKAAIDEHWTLMYGPEAGKYLKEFYDLMVATWEGKVIPQITTVSEDVSIRGNIKPRHLYSGFDLKTIDKMDDLLKKAKKAVKPNTIEAQRLDYFLEPWAKQITSARAYHNTQIPVYKVARLNDNEQIIIDANPNDEAWKRAVVCKLRESQGYEYQFPEQPEARMIWSDKGIYLLLTAQKKPVDNPGEIWKQSDCWEFLFSPGMKKDYYYQFAFNPNGNLYQAERDVTEGVGGVFQCKGLQLKSSFDDKGWVAEMFVPFDGLKHKGPAVYSTWFGNVIYSQRRTVTANNISASFSFTMKDNRNMDLWGQFKFMGFDD
ncbi:MAG: DUF4838 domain-containing protein [Victivallales bacterium]|nr:DUF4838 domain-containing protein [Victivallales bacterium]